VIVTKDKESSTYPESSLVETARNSLWYEAEEAKARSQIPEGSVLYRLLQEPTVVITGIVCVLPAGTFSSSQTIPSLLERLDIESV